MLQSLGVKYHVSQCLFSFVELELCCSQYILKLVDSMQVLEQSRQCREHETFGDRVELFYGLQYFRFFHHSFFLKLLQLIGGIQVMPQVLFVHQLAQDHPFNIFLHYVHILFGQVVRVEHKLRGTCLVQDGLELFKPFDNSHQDRVCANLQ